MYSFVLVYTHKNIFQVDVFVHIWIPSGWTELSWLSSACALVIYIHISTYLYEPVLYSYILVCTALYSCCT